jgi:uncharacterized membrane protein YjjP (DUF1212 family)
MNYKLLADTAMLAGELLLRSGAETYRVEDTMYHILKTSNSDFVEAMALMTGLVVTVNDKSFEQPLTVMRRVTNRSTNISMIVKVNDISRRYCGGSITLEEAYEELQIAKEKPYNRLMYNLGTIGMVMGFAALFGGGGWDLVIAALTGAVLAGFITFSKIVKLNGIFTNALSGMLIAVLVTLVQAFVLPGIGKDIIIISAIMPIVPGVAITNAIRDTLQGDYLSGCARILEALLIAAAIAVGVGLGVILCGSLIGGRVL